MLCSFVSSTIFLKKALFVVASFPSNNPVAARTHDPVHTVKTYSAPGSCLLTNAGSAGGTLFDGAMRFARSGQHLGYIQEYHKAQSLTTRYEDYVKLFLDAVVGRVRQQFGPCGWNNRVHVMRQKSSLDRYIRGVRIGKLWDDFLEVLRTQSEKLDRALEIQRRQIGV
jgi:hypothetical protein